MKKENIIIKNRKNLKISIRLSIPDNATKLAFLEHGFSGAKDEKHILIMEEKLICNRYVVVNFDATNSINESDTSKEGITFTSHYTDLEDVIDWAKAQSWYKEPFLLSGHSMGATSVVLYAERHSKLVNTLITLALSRIKGDSFLKQHSKEFIEDYKRKGFFERTVARSDRVHHVPYSFLEDLLNYDFISNAKNIDANTVLIIGDADYKIRLEENKIFYEALDCKKQLIILPDVPHSLAKDDNHAKLFAETLDNVLSEC